MRLRGSVPVHPTEEPGKVLRSVTNIFPDIGYEREGDQITFITEDISTFAGILRDHRIRDTAVMVLERGLQDDSASFFLNKQAAFAGRINFTEGDSTLGDIHVVVEEGGVELIDSIRPKAD